MYDFVLFPLFFIYVTGEEQGFFLTGWYLLAA